MYEVSERFKFFIFKFSCQCFHQSAITMKNQIIDLPANLFTMSKSLSFPRTIMPRDSSGSDGNVNQL